jgi:hypothetical protein
MRVYSLATSGAGFYQTVLEKSVTSRSPHRQVNSSMLNPRKSNGLALECLGAITRKGTSEFAPVPQVRSRLRHHSPLG